VPDKSKVFHVVACFRGTGGVSDGKLSAHRPVLHYVSVGKYLTLLVQTPRKFSICNTV
jgi:hypothetical protein